MGLSEHEQRMLDELEQGLRNQDAKFAQRVSAGRTSSAVKVIAGSMVMLAGISVLVLAAVIHWTPIGILGFALMLTGLLIATATKPGQTPRPGGAERPGPKGQAPKSAKGTGSIVDFFEKRWDNRNPGA